MDPILSHFDCTFIFLSSVLSSDVVVSEVSSRSVVAESFKGTVPHFVLCVSRIKVCWRLDSSEVNRSPAAHTDTVPLHFSVTFRFLPLIAPWQHKMNDLCFNYS